MGQTRRDFTEAIGEVSMARKVVVIVQMVIMAATGITGLSTIQFVGSRIMAHAIFGIKCRLSHCCLTCTENGRHGNHKAINYGSKSIRGRTEGQRS